ncbi:hypothetical protein GF373_07690 [bacterium]|nr:hypothetical protein [bacterium]
MYISLFLFCVFAGLLFVTVPFSLQAQSPTAQVNTVEYEYDSAGRLIQATYNEHKHIHYHYDDAGNMIGREITDDLTRVESWSMH